MNRNLIRIGLLSMALIWTACDLFQPVSPDPSDKFIKLFGGREDQTSAALHVFGDSLYYILGTSSSFTDDARTATYLVLADRAGNRVWQRTLASASPETAIDMLLLDNALLLVSRLSANDGTRILVRQLDLDGVVMWEKVIAGQPGTDYAPSDLVPVPNTGSFLIVGSASVQGTSQIYAVQLDTTQQVAWQKTYSLLDRQSEYGVAGHIHNGNLLILGESVSAQGVTRPILIEADRNSVGEELQSKICYQDDATLPNTLPALGLTPLTGDDFMVLSQLDTEAALLPVAVRTQDRITPDAPLSTALTITPEALAYLPAGDLLLLGQSDTHLNLMQLDLQGNSRWEALRQYGYPSARNRGTAIGTHSDGSLALLGTLDFFENTMIGLLKTNADGLQ